MYSTLYYSSRQSSLLIFVCKVKNLHHKKTRICVLVIHFYMVISKTVAVWLNFFSQYFVDTFPIIIEAVIIFHTISRVAIGLLFQARWKSCTLGVISIVLTGFVLGCQTLKHLAYGMIHH